MKYFQLNSAVIAGLVSALALPPAIAIGPVQDDEKADEQSGDESKDEDEETSYLALVGGDIHTGTGAVLREATILIEDETIKEFGYNVVVPDDAEVVDVSGMRVYPGLVAVNSFGLFGGGGDLDDSVDPYSSNMTLALAAGITTAVNGNTVAKLKRGSIEGLVVAKSAFENLTYLNNNPQGKLKVVENFEKAEEYLRKYAEYENEKRSNKDAKEPSKKGIDDKSVRILRNEVRPRFNADSRTDLMEIAELARRFGFRPIIAGATEGWTMPAELGRAGATAIVSPRSSRSASERLVKDNGSSIENAAKLYDHGVPVVVVPAQPGISLGGIVGRDLLHMPIEAAFAVRGGLPEQAALQSITIEAARVLGLGHRIGSIEVGKDADLIVTDGDVLHYATFVQWAVVDGEIVYDKEDEMYFAHIRPRPESELAPAEKVDPGEEGAVDPEADGDEGEGEGEGEGDAAPGDEKKGDEGSGGV